MKTKAAAIAVLAAAASVWVWGSARAQMMSGMMEPEHGMMGSAHGMMAGRVAGMMGPELTGGCWADLGDLGLSAAARTALEDKRLEMRKKTIRGLADLEVLRLELARMLEDRSFDLQVAEKKTAEIGQKESELRAAHLGFLHDLGAALSDDQWRKLGEKRKEMMSSGMMPMMQGMAPCMTGGMMMGQGAPSGGGAHGAHHPGASGEAEKFFQEKK